MKLDGTPRGYLTVKEVAERLGGSVRNLQQSGIIPLLDYYEIPQSRLYVVESVEQMKYWLLARKAGIAFGYLYEKSPLCPPRLAKDRDVDLSPPADAKSRQMFLNAWYDEDAMGTYCDVCCETAFTNGELGEDEKIWCPTCGVGVFIKKSGVLTVG